MRLPRFSVHPFAAAGIFILLFAVPPEKTFAIVTVTVLHELGHGAAAVLLGRRIEGVVLMPVGISMKIDTPPSYYEEILIAFAGPFENLLLIALGRFFPCGESIRAFSEITLFINLMPMATLDGGRIISALASLRFGAGVGEKIIRATTAVTLFFLWILAVYVFFYTAENVALLIFCSYIFAGYIASKGIE